MKMNTDKYSLLSASQQAVFREILSSQREGVEKQAIAENASFSESLDGILQFLEGEQLVKTVRHRVNNASRTIYLGYETVPAKKYQKGHNHKNPSRNLEDTSAYSNIIDAYIAHTTIKSICSQAAHLKTIDQYKNISRGRAGVSLHEVYEFMSLEYPQERLDLSTIELICLNLFYEDRVEMVEDRSNFAASFKSMQNYMDQRYGAVQKEPQKGESKESIWYSLLDVVPDVDISLRASDYWIRH